MRSKKTSQKETLVELRRLRKSIRELNERNHFLATRNNQLRKDIEALKKQVADYVLRRDSLSIWGLPRTAHSLDQIQTYLLTGSYEPKTSQDEQE